MAVRAADSDITIKSSDDVEFKVHRKNLDMFAEGFPGEEMKLTPEESVKLSETSKTLEILFQYMYRQPQPDLSEFPFEDVSAVAEASEKYFVFAAMEVCKIHMRYKTRTIQCQCHRLTDAYA